MDGGYSTKRVANAGLVDTRVFDSSYLLPRPYVDSFKDEVKKRARATVHDVDDEVSKEL